MIKKFLGRTAFLLLVALALGSLGHAIRITIQYHTCRNVFEEIYVAQAQWEPQFPKDFAIIQSDLFWASGTRISMVNGIVWHTTVENFRMQKLGFLSCAIRPRESRSYLRSKKRSTGGSIPRIPLPTISIPKHCRAITLMEDLYLIISCLHGLRQREQAVTSPWSH